MKIKEFQTQIEELNDYAIEKLNEKGADISADASTFQIINSFLTLDNDTEELEKLIDESGVLDSTEGTAMDKVEQLINIVKEIFIGLDEIDALIGKVTKNFLKSSDGFILTDINGIYIIPKESE